MNKNTASIFGIVFLLILVAFCFIKASRRKDNSSGTLAGRYDNPSYKLGERFTVAMAKIDNVRGTDWVGRQEVVITYTEPKMVEITRVVRNRLSTKESDTLLLYNDQMDAVIYKR